jgi:hypothetical protein
MIGKAALCLPLQTKTGMKGFIAFIVGVLLALVCHSGAEQRQAVDGTVAEVGCVRKSDNASIRESRDAGWLLQEDDGMTYMVGEVPDVTCRANASVKSLSPRYISVETAHFIKTLLRNLMIRMDNLTYCCTLVHDSSRTQNWDNACEHYVFGMRRILI